MLPVVICKAGSFTSKMNLKATTFVLSVILTGANHGVSKRGDTPLYLFLVKESKCMYRLLSGMVRKWDGKTKTQHFCGHWRRAMYTKPDVVTGWAISNTAHTLCLKQTLAAAHARFPGLICDTWSASVEWMLPEEIHLKFSVPSSSRDIHLFECESLRRTPRKLVWKCINDGSWK